MAAPKIMSGARAKVGIYNPNTGFTQIVGLFSSLSYTVIYNADPAYTLGSYLPQEVDYTYVSPVDITASGWKVINHGMHADGNVPRVQDLATHEYVEFWVDDRQRQNEGQPAEIIRITKVRPLGASGGFQARQLSEMQFRYIGLIVEEDGVVNAEGPGATFIP